MRSLAFVVVGALFLGGCAERIAEHRVRSALIDAGISEGHAQCMAERLVDRLSISQLRRLESLKGSKRTLAEYAETVRELGDPELIGVTVSSAALCSSGMVR